MGAKTARRRRRRNLYGGKARLHYRTNASIRRQIRYARRELRRMCAEEERHGHSPGFRVHPEFGRCEWGLEALGLRPLEPEGHKYLTITWAF